MSTSAAVVQAANTARANAAAIAVETDAATNGVDRSGWHTYRDDRSQFTIEYPGALAATPSGDARIDLPFDKGTNLTDKYVDIFTTSEGSGTCASPRFKQYPPAFVPQTVIINGVSFSRFADIGAAAGNRTDWQGYWASRGDACVVLDFVLDSASLSSYGGTPPPAYDSSEGQVFSWILATFRWLTP